MSRQPQLPPRCPIPKKTSQISDSLSLIHCGDRNSYSRHQKSASQSFVLEEQPAWLDDLLGDCDTDFNPKSHRRAASDSGTVLDDLVELSNLNTNDTNSCSGDSCTAPTALESACVYGPNSPRSKDKVSFQGSDIVSALSGYASQIPMQHIDAELFVSGFRQLDSVPDACGSVGEVSMEAKSLKRHSGQRSRVRKLQYIAELERSVETFEKMVWELGARVDSLVELHVYLSMENKQLKQQLARLQQEKFLMDGQYQWMRKEVEGLKVGGKVRRHLRSNSWQMLDMSKLHIN